MPIESVRPDEAQPDKRIDRPKMEGRASLCHVVAEMNGKVPAEEKRTKLKGIAGF